MNQGEMDSNTQIVHKEWYQFWRAELFTTRPISILLFYFYFN